VNAQHPVFPLAVCRLYALLLGAILSVIGIGATFAAPAPQITSFQAAPIDELAPGTELNFRVEGTPRSQVGVRIMGIGQSIPLKETSYGVYEGNYTIKRSDRPAANPAVRAMLRQQNVAVTSRLQTPLVGASAIAEPSATIQRFAMEPGAIEPGAELNFSLQGTPNGRVSVTIDRIARRVPLTEVQPGLYEGTYTVRRQDRFTGRRERQPAGGRSNSSHAVACTGADFCARAGHEPARRRTCLRTASDDLGQPRQQC
jgi:hypothetical protein